MLFDFADKTVLITGGTRGIGLATGLAFAKLRAQTILTYRWGGDDEAVLREFERSKAKRPLILQADVSDSADTRQLMDRIAASAKPVDIFVASATGAAAVDSFDSLSRRAVLSSFRYGVWPLVEYLQVMKSVLGTYPKYTVALSTTGIVSYVRNYDLVATSKAALETLCRYVAFRLRGEDCRVNIVRTRAIETKSANEIVGRDIPHIARLANAAKQLIHPEEVADVIVALCSGLLDDMNGEILTVDRGGLLADNLDRLFTERDKIGL